MPRISPKGSIGSLRGGFCARRCAKFTVSFKEKYMIKNIIILTEFLTVATWLAFLRCNLNDPAEVKDAEGINVFAFVSDTEVADPSLVDSIRYATCDTVAPGDTLLFIGFIEHKDQRIATITWDFNDGDSCTALITKHAFKNSGIYQAIFCIMGKTGDILCDTVSVCVNIPPAGIELLSPPRGAIDQPLIPTFSWKGADPDYFDTSLLYILLVFKEPGNVDTIMSWSTITSVSPDLNLSKSQKVGWIVCARDHFGAIVSSDTSWFSTERRNDAALASLAVYSDSKAKVKRDVKPGFSPDTLGYSIKLPDSEEVVWIAPVPRDSQALVTANGEPVRPRDLSQPIKCTADMPCSVSVTVVAQDEKTNKTYSLVILHERNCFPLSATASNGEIKKIPDQPRYCYGTMVQVTALPSRGYHFYGWRGDVESSENPIQILMDAGKTIQANIGNAPPIISGCFDTAIQENTLLELHFKAVDPDDDSVTLLSGTLPTGAAFNADSGIFRWTPTHAQSLQKEWTWSVFAKDAIDMTEKKISITVYSAPIIERQPLGATVCDGEPVILSVKASGTPPLSYQWIKDGFDITGANSDSLRIKSPSADDAGAYVCRIANGHGKTITDSAVLVVRISPALTAQPANAIKCQGDSVEFRVIAVGASPLSFQWRKNSTNLPGETKFTLRLRDITANDNGAYTCMISNSCGNIKSDSARLTVNTPSTTPSGIAATPSTMCKGDSTTLTVTGGALGSGDMWRWYADSCSGLSIAKGSTVRLSPSTTTTYFVRAEGTCAPTPCASATLTVKTPSIAPNRINVSLQPVCKGKSTQLGIDGGTIGTGAQWIWYHGEDSIGVGSLFTVKPCSTTTYSVIARGDCNQTEKISVTVIVDSISTMPDSIAVSMDTICRGDSCILSVRGGKLGAEAVWRWTDSYGSSKFTGPTIKVGPLHQTTYFVWAEGRCDTTSSKAATVYVDSLSVTPIGIITHSAKVCSGSKCTLSVNGGKLGSGAAWKWYKDSCGGKPFDSGETVSPSVLKHTTFFVRAEGKCNVTGSAEVIVSLNKVSYPASKIEAYPSQICQNANATLTIYGGSLGDNALWKWYSDTTKPSSFIDTGVQIRVSPANTTTYYLRAEGTCGNTYWQPVQVSVNKPKIQSITFQPTIKPCCETQYCQVACPPDSIIGLWCTITPIPTDALCSFRIGAKGNWNHYGGRFRISGDPNWKGTISAYAILGDCMSDTVSVTR
jgi:hypothetical protein